MKPDDRVRLRHIVDALSAAIRFTGLVAQPPIATRRGPLCWLGVGAYSIYLFHMPVAMLLSSRLVALQRSCLPR